jgi:hypothetical protein
MLVGGVFMKENMKLKLSELKVQTFITSLNEDEKKKVKGGYYTQVPCTGAGCTLLIGCTFGGC